MPLLDPSLIRDWHAHIYFDAQSRSAAWELRETIARELAGHMEMGHFHERPVGPHPMWSYLLYFRPKNFSRVFNWLVLNHGSLDVFVHPNTANELRDHRDSAIWLGHSHSLILTGLSDLD